MLTTTLRLLEGTGAWFIFWLQGTAGVLRLIGNCLAWVAGGWIFGQPVRLSAIAMQIFESGTKALPVTILIAVSFGAIIGHEAAQFQKSIDYLPPILAFAGNFFVREQAPAILGILMAARAGGAITAEISTMVFDREIMALRSMGVDPVRFLVAPAFVAMLVVTPLLCLVMAAVEVLTMALFLFLTKGIAPNFVINLTVDGISAVDLLLNVVKGCLFGMTILGIAARTGLTVAERGRSTGSATTFAIVTSIVFVLIINAFLSIYFPN